MCTAPGRSVHHFCPDWNISTTIGWISIKVCTDILGPLNPEDLNDPWTIRIVVMIQETKGGCHSHSHYYHYGLWDNGPLGTDMYHSQSLVFHLFVVILSLHDCFAYLFILFASFCSCLSFFLVILHLFVVLCGSFGRCFVSLLVTFCRWSSRDPLTPWASLHKTV